MNWWNVFGIAVFVMFSSFMSFVYVGAGQAGKAPPVRTMALEIKCYDQRVVTGHMKQRGFKILFNWMSRDGKLIKIVAANKNAHVMVVHIHDSTDACVVDELLEGTSGRNSFMELFDLVKHEEYYGTENFTSTY